MKRKVALKRSGRLQRTRLRAKGKRTKKSGGHLFPKHVDENYRGWIRQHNCVIGRGCPMGDWGFVDVAHVRSRGAAGVDHANLVPLCHFHHMEQHDCGRLTFAGRHGVDLVRAAQALWERYQAEQIGDMFMRAFE